MFRRGVSLGGSQLPRIAARTQTSSVSSSYLGAAAACSPHHVWSPSQWAGRSCVLPTAATTRTQYRFSSTDATTTPGGGSQEEESRRIAKLLEEDPKLLEEVVATMSGEQRRRFTVAGGAYEWFGKDKVSTELVAADVDKDKIISPKDFNNWFDNALKRHTDSLASNPDSTDTAKGKEDAAGSKVGDKVAMSALFFIALECGLPFVGFGFLDNATMILAGDAIDKSLGAFLHCSVMASAAMGNVVSGMMGMQVHGFVEKMVHWLGLPTPILTSEQRKSTPVFMAGHIGGTVGIFIGLTLGMLPLLVINSDESEEAHASRKWFDSLDHDKSGKVHATELQRGLKVVGVDMPLTEVESWIAEHTSVGTTALDYDQFKALYSVMLEQKENKKKAAA